MKQLELEMDTLADCEGDDQREQEELLPCEELLRWRLEWKTDMVRCLVEGRLQRPYFKVDTLLQDADDLDPDLIQKAWEVGAQRAVDDVEFVLNNWREVNEEEHKRASSASAQAGPRTMRMSAPWEELDKAHHVLDGAKEFLQVEQLRERLNMLQPAVEEMRTDWARVQAECVAQIDRRLREFDERKRRR